MQDRRVELCKGAGLCPAVLPSMARHCCAALQLHPRLTLVSTGRGVTCHAQSFAMFGGVYAFASCMVQRIRDKQDGEGSFGPRRLLLCPWGAVWLVTQV